MVNLCDLKKEPQINYPTFWDYKVIFEVHVKASEIFEEILGQREYNLNIRIQVRVENIKVIC